MPRVGRPAEPDGLLLRRAFPPLGRRGPPAFVAHPAPGVISAPAGALPYQASGTSPLTQILSPRAYLEKFTAGRTQVLTNRSGRSASGAVLLTKQKANGGSICFAGASPPSRFPSVRVPESKGWECVGVGFRSKNGAKGAPRLSLDQEHNSQKLNYRN